MDKILTIIFATGNMGKVREIREILSGMDAEVYTMKEFGIHPEIIEDGTTFMENSRIKVKKVADVVEKLLKGDAVTPDEVHLTPMGAAILAERDIRLFMIMADDSGLVVDALGGEPGIYSARYLGEETSYTIKNANIIERLNGVPDEQRTARFICAIAALYYSEGEWKALEAEAPYEGRIGYEEKGENGFGYDPIFYLPDRNCYSAELDPDEKNRISHRGKALVMMQDAIAKLSLE